MTNAEDKEGRDAGQDLLKPVQCFESKMSPA